MKYFTEKTEMISLKDVLAKASVVDQPRIQRLWDALGDIEISQEFLTGFLQYYSYSSARRGDYPLTKESIQDLFTISQMDPELTGLSIKMIMGEYVKDVFDAIRPLEFFKGKIMEEKESSFEDFIRYLRDLGDKSDLEYQEEAKKAESLSLLYGERFAKYIGELLVSYHKRFDDVFYLIPYASVIRKDADKFYEIARREIFGARGVPYSYQMCKHMILFGNIDAYRDRELLYSSSLKGEFPASITADEFMKSVKIKQEQFSYQKEL